MKIPFILRHRCFHRTRLQYACLKNNRSLCHHLEDELLGQYGVVRVEARPQTGSLILCHPQGLADLQQIIVKVEQACGSFVPMRQKNSVEQKDADNLAKKKRHVSGLTLVVSGLYLLYLFLKRVFVTQPASLLPLPALVTVALSWPIQRQATENLKKTGRPDMGLISTVLLYSSLAMGNVLTSYTIFWLFNLSSWLESLIQNRTRQTIREMLLARDDKVWLVKDGGEFEVKADILQPGDKIVLRLGSVVPVDGRIRKGQAFVDESMLTGESQPIVRRQGERVLSGTVIREGEIVVEAEKTGEETRLAGIVRMVESAEKDPGELQRFSHQLSQAMVPVSLGIVTAGFLFTGSLMQAITLLIIACPCALRLSSSVAVSSTMAASSREGILVKGGRYLEQAAQIETLIVDKTGTLTLVDDESLEITVLDRRFREEKLLQLAASLQRTWPHPTGRKLLKLVAKQGIELLYAEVLEFEVGRGIRACIDDNEILLGSEKFLKNAGVSFSARKQKILAEDNGKPNQLFLAYRGNCLAVFSSAQHFRGQEKEALAKLRANGIQQLVLLSGDLTKKAEEVGISLGFDEVLGGQSPEEKARWITRYRDTHPQAVIAMVGDGINDTPAFASADISFAIADGGSDVTIEYGDIVLQYGGLEKVARLHELAVGMNQTIKQSYGMAISLNFLLLLGIVTGLVPPLTGALIHNGVTVGVVGYAAGKKFP